VCDSRSSDGRPRTIDTSAGSVYPLGKKPRLGNLLALQNKAFGVLRRTLHDGGYEHDWVGLPTDPAFEDSGSGACR
jgi:hypothetical protein